MLPWIIGWRRAGFESACDDDMSYARDILGESIALAVLA